MCAQLGPLAGTVTRDTVTGHSTSDQQRETEPEANALAGDSGKPCAARFLSTELGKAPHAGAGLQQRASQR